MAAPMSLFYGEANRSSAIRIPAYAENAEEARVEYRLPDALCNPYLAMAAQLMAGLDGVKNKIDPTAEGYGPFDFNNYTLSAEEKAKIKTAPNSLEETLAALDKDRAFLTAGGVFPEEVIETWIKLKNAELAALKARPHPLEYEMYYDL
jgi:glutamine synthetase